MPSRLPLPDVVIGGAPRSGTTFLAQILANHPAIYLAQPIAPEPKVCLRERATDADYLADYAGFFANAPENSVRVEKTTNYFESAQARGRLAHLLPEARFLFILREPVARAYSNWKWSRHNGLETLPFAEAIAQESHRENPFGAERPWARPFDYMARGRYGSLAEAWYRAMGAQRVHFVLFEDFVNRPEKAVESLQHWLNIEALPWSKLRSDKVNATPEDLVGLDPVFEEQLRGAILPEVRKFGKITGLDTASWGYPPT